MRGWGGAGWHHSVFYTPVSVILLHCKNRRIRNLKEKVKNVLHKTMNVLIVDAHPCANRSIIQAGKYFHLNADASSTLLQLAHEDFPSPKANSRPTTNLHHIAVSGIGDGENVRAKRFWRIDTLLPVSTEHSQKNEYAETHTQTTSESCA